jgi:hypothetical protein
MPETHVPSPREVEESKSPGGAWTKATLAEWGVTWPPPKGWRTKLFKRWAREHGMIEFESACDRRISGKHDWVDHTPATAVSSKIFTCSICQKQTVTRVY